MSALFTYKNPNPCQAHNGDCVIRAISIITGETWEKVYVDLCVQGLMMCDMPSSNAVWGAYLNNIGFKRDVLPNKYPDCFTVAEFCENNSKGEYLLATGSHLVAVKDGTYFDIWDSGSEVPTYFFYKDADKKAVK